MRTFLFSNSKYTTNSAYTQHYPQTATHTRAFGRKCIRAGAWLSLCLLPRAGVLTSGRPVVVHFVAIQPQAVSESELAALIEAAECGPPYPLSSPLSRRSASLE